jgi:tetratricopeptide (TPR) repeat protein
MISLLANRIMNRKPKPSKILPVEKQTQAAGRPTPSTMSRRRLWLMRLAAATLVPLFLLGAVELGLRLAGYGFQTSYFRPSTIAGQNYLLPNAKFAYRFFPPALARAPLPMRMLAEKPANTYRIFLFGESAAQGDPDPAYGFGRYLELLLNARYPGTNFEVVCVAMVAINSHAILPIARECARLDGDLWIIYMGNNEMIGAYGPGTVFGTKAPRLGIVRTILALKTTKIGQLMDALLAGVRSTSAAPEAWGGIGMFSKNQLRHDDEGRLRAYENFKGNLADILSVGQQAGVPIILSTVASNLRDCAPFASLHSPDLAATELSEWEKLYQQGMAWEAAGSYSNALTAYTNAAAIDSQFAELQYRIGNCHLALTNREAAHQALVAARDYDVLSVRADSRLNQIVLDAAKPYDSKQVLPVDAARALADDSPDGILGKELFYEHVHFTPQGNYRLARIFAERVKTLLPDSIGAPQGVDWADAEFCNRGLAVTSWDDHRLWQGAINNTAGPPFSTQASHRSNSQYLESRRQDVIARMTPDSPARDRQLYEEALAAAPEDTLLRSRFAQYLEATGSRADAIKEFQRVCELLPDLEWPYYHLGDLLVRAGRFSEAAESFKRALAIRSDFFQARKELERIRASHLPPLGVVF